MKNVQFFKDKNILGKDLQGVCELLQYEEYENGHKLYDYHDYDDRLFIVLDGRVEFSVDMKTQVLTGSELQDLAFDVSFPQIGNQFMKFKQQNGLTEYDGNKKFSKSLGLSKMRKTASGIMFFQSLKKMSQTGGTQMRLPLKSVALNIPNTSIKTKKETDINII